jgi:hypothetical protein
VSAEAGLEVFAAIWPSTSQGGVTILCWDWLWRDLRSRKNIGSRGEVNGGISELGAERPAIVDFASGDLTCGEQCPEQPWPRSRRRQGRLGLDAALELLVERPIAFLCARALPLAKGQPCKGKEPATDFLQAVGDDLAFEPPSAHEGSPALLDLRGRVA